MATRKAAGTAPLADPRPAKWRDRRPISLLRSEALGLAAGRVGVAVVFLALWQVLSATVLDPFFVSTPDRVARQLWGYLTGDVLWVALGFTLYETFAGLAIGIVLGVLAGLGLAGSRIADQLLMPYMTMLNTIPRFALAPLFIVYFGIGAESKIVLVVSMVFFILLTNTYAGVKSVDRDLSDLMRMMRASRVDVFRKLYWPSLVPWLFAAFHLALAYALASAVVGEMIAAQNGLGVLIARDSGLFNISGVFALLVILAAVAMSTELTISKVERWLLRWRFTGRGPSSNSTLVQ